VDWNNDGKNDLVAGDTEGSISLFLNIGTKEKPVLAEGKKVEADGKVITGKRETYKEVNGNYVVDKVIPESSDLAEVYTKIHIADWDDDGLKDLLVGHDSTIIMYKNVGSPSAPSFLAPILIKDQLPSRPSPYVIDWDGDGKKDLLVGLESPEVYFYRNIGTNKDPQLDNGQKLDLKVPGAEAGYRWRIDVNDWNNDGKKDIIAGNIYTIQQGDDHKSGGNLWLFLGK
jgi:hypothetical protein